MPPCHGDGVPHPPEPLNAPSPFGGAVQVQGAWPGGRREDGGGHGAIAAREHVVPAITRTDMKKERELKRKKKKKKTEIN